MCSSCILFTFIHFKKSFNVMDIHVSSAICSAYKHCIQKIYYRCFFHCFSLPVYVILVFLTISLACFDFSCRNCITGGGLDGQLPKVFCCEIPWSCRIYQYFMMEANQVLYHSTMLWSDDCDNCLVVLMLQILIFFGSTTYLFATYLVVVEFIIWSCCCHMLLICFGNSREI